MVWPGAAAACWEAPFGVWEDRGPAVQERLAGWGDQVFGSVFGTGPARDAYQQARDRGVEVVFRSANPGVLGLPWELMRDGAGPVALGSGGGVAEPAGGRWRGDAGGAGRAAAGADGDLPAAVNIRFCRIARVACSHAYALTRMFTRALEGCPRFR